MFKKFWRWLMGCFEKVAKGELLLGYGLHEITINIDGTPCRVCFTVTDPANGCCVCHGDINKIGITTGSNGFVIYADIKSNTCLIEWKCEYKNGTTIQEC
jgi:hypothetical protein